MIVEERTPPLMEQAFELELSLLGADGVDGIDAYLNAQGSTQIHPLLAGFLDRLRPFRATASQLAARWAQWDEYRSALARFFQQFDAIVCPVYTQPALAHGDSLDPTNFEGFSYTMAWNVAGSPAATVRCAESAGLPINVQIATRPWNDVLALEICLLIEKGLAVGNRPLFHIENRFDLDRDVARQTTRAYCRPRMPSSLAEHLHKEIRTSVDHLRLLLKLGGTVYQTEQLHHPAYPSKIPQCLPRRSQQLIRQAAHDRTPSSAVTSSPTFPVLNSSSPTRGPWPDKNRRLPARA